MFQWQLEDPVNGSQGACYDAPVELKTPEYVKTKQKLKNPLNHRFDLLTTMPIHGAWQVFLSD